MPGAGTLVLTGRGIRKVSRRSSGAAKLKLPIKPIGEAKRRLADSGRARLELRLSFVPVGGSIGTATRPVKLIKHLGPGAAQ